MVIERIEETNLTPQDEEQIANLLARAFDADFGGRSYYMQRHHIRLILRDGPIIGHMALSFRAIRINDALTDVMLLGDVATDPDRRGQGIASRLLKAAIEDARDSRAAHFMLFGDAKLYAGHGFMPANAHYRCVDLTGARTGTVDEREAQVLMVLPVSDKPWPDGAQVDFVGGLF